MRTCSVVGCEGKHFGRGYCRVHYERWKRNGDPLLLQRPGGVCSIEGCEKPVNARRMCRPHYRRWMKHGDALAPRTESVKDDPGRWAAMVETTDGCWLWKGGVGSNGYGNFWADGRTVLAHRFAYELLVGPIPTDMHLDHLCRVRHCVRPDHLEPVTVAENNRRSASPSARNALKTHCPRNHPYDEANTYYDNRGSRVCKACQLAANARQRERKKRG